MNFEALKSLFPQSRGAIKKQISNGLKKTGKVQAKKSIGQIDSVGGLANSHPIEGSFAGNTVSEETVDITPSAQFLSSLPGTNEPSIANIKNHLHALKDTLQYLFKEQSVDINKTNNMEFSLNRTYKEVDVKGLGQQNKPMASMLNEHEPFMQYVKTIHFMSDFAKHQKMDTSPDKNKFFVLINDKINAASQGVEQQHQFSFQYDLFQLSLKANGMQWLTTDRNTANFNSSPHTGE